MVVVGRKKRGKFPNMAVPHTVSTLENSPKKEGKRVVLHDYYLDDPPPQKSMKTI